VKTSGEFVKVTVPDGADGEPWHFSQMTRGRLKLFNAPNHLAASPAALVPKDVVERDGLRPAVKLR
jgi:hypothetical protein